MVNEETGNSDDPASAAINRFSCEACGADMRFDPSGGALMCDHCGQTADVTETHRAAIRELEFDDGLNLDLADRDTQELQIVKCANCAAQFEFAQDSFSEECPFCATPVVVDAGIVRAIRPKGVLPFSVAEQDARAAMRDWFGRLWFAPRGLQQFARKGRRLQGVYMPYWTFDADTQSNYSGERGTVYYDTTTVMRDGRHVQKRVQKIRWRPKSGTIARWFDDVLVLASKSLPKSFTDGLVPWDLERLEPYLPEFVAGFRAEGYTIELQDGFAIAREHMDRVIRRAVKFDISGDRQRIHSLSTHVSDVTFKHILLPVWMAAYKYRGRTFRCVVNGRTGRVQGERPWSGGKIALAIIAVALVGGALGFLIAINQSDGAAMLQAQ